MRILAFLIILCSTVLSWSQSNVEIRATYVKDNKNYIYMESKTEKLKLRKSELTKEGVDQILANKENELTLFIPPKSIVSRSEKKQKSEEY